MTKPDRDIRNFFFKYRSFTPIPLAILLVYFAQPGGNIWIFGLIILFFGEWIRFSGVRYAGGITRTSKVGAPSLCTSGPFSRVRNPLYVGNMFMYTGVVIFAGAPNLFFMLIVTWAFFLIQYSLIVSLEEEALTTLFGHEYQTYKDNVPALIPRLRAWKNNDDRKPMSIKKTFRTEKRTFQNIVFILLLILIRLQY